MKRRVSYRDLVHWLDEAVCMLNEWRPDFIESEDADDIVCFDETVRRIERVLTKAKGELNAENDEND